MHRLLDCKDSNIYAMRNKKVAFLIIFSALVFVACSQKPVKNADNQSESAAIEAPVPEESSYVLIETDFGNITVRLYNETPRHRDNFLKLVKEGFYDGLLFHRVIKNFMIQGGDPKSKDAQPGQMLGDGGLPYTVPAEFVPTLFHKKGALAAARQGDNVNPNKESSSCQFYIVQGNVWNPNQLKMMEYQMQKHFSQAQIDAYTTVGGTPHLDGDYTVFGEVVEGLDVVDKIAAVQCGQFDRPVKDVKMKMKVIQK